MCDTGGVGGEVAAGLIAESDRLRHTGTDDAHVLFHVKRYTTRASVISGPTTKQGLLYRTVWRLFLVGGATLVPGHIPRTSPGWASGITFNISSTMSE